MKIKIAERAKEGENAIRQRFAQQAALDKEMTAAGLEATLKLSIGQPHIVHSPVLDITLKELAREESSLPTGYSPSKGRPEYVRYATALFNARNPALDAKDENVLLTMGGTGALAALAAVVLEPGRKVLFPVPGFAAQPPALRGYGAEVIEVETHDTGYKLSPERLEIMLQDHPETAFVVFNDITNPTGAKYSEEELRGLGDVFRKNSNLLIFCDETYHDLALDPQAKFFLEVNPDLKGQVVIEYSTAKDIAGEPGLRGGMVYAPTVMDQDGREVNLAEKMAGQQLNMCTAMPTIVQYKIARILEAKLDKSWNPATKIWEEGGNHHASQSGWEEAIRQEYRQNLNIAREAFADVGMPVLVEPGGGFFLLIDAGKFIGREIPNEVTSRNGLVIDNLHERVGGMVLDSDIKVANYLAQVANMVTVEASPFGMPKEIGALRVSVANSPENLQKIPGCIRYAENYLLPEVSRTSSPPEGTILGNGNTNHQGTVTSLQGVHRA